MTPASNKPDNLKPIVFSTRQIFEFNAITLDNNPMHTSDTYSRSMGFEGIVVNGALTLSMAISLSVDYALHKLNKSFILLNTGSTYRSPIYTNIAYHQLLYCSQTPVANAYEFTVRYHMIDTGDEPGKWLHSHTILAKIDDIEH